MTTGTRWYFTLSGAWWAAHAAVVPMVQSEGLIGDSTDFDKGERLSQGRYGRKSYASADGSRGAV